MESFGGGDNEGAISFNEYGSREGGRVPRKARLSKMEKSGRER